MILNGAKVLERILRIDRDVSRDEAMVAVYGSYDDLCRKYPWPFLIVDGKIDAVADWTTGTVSVTQGSDQATFSTTPSAAIVGRHVQITSSTRFYKINALSGAVVTLEGVYEGSTDTVATFTVRQMDHRMPVDFMMWHSGRESSGLQWVEVDDLHAYTSGEKDVFSSGTVQCIVPHGMSSKSLYNVGSLTTTYDSADVTLATGAWVQARDQYRRLVFRAQPELGWFRINSIAGAVATLDRAYRGREGSGLAYDVDPPGEQFVRLYPQPTANTSVLFKYYRALPPLQNAEDWPALPSHYHEAWVHAALARLGLPSDLQKELGVLLQRAGLKKFGLVRASMFGTRAAGSRGSVLGPGWPAYRPRGRR